MLLVLGAWALCPAPKYGHTEFEVSVAGDELKPTRRFRVTAPAMQEEGPVLLAFHGQYGSPAEVWRSHGFDAMARKKGFSVVYLEGDGDMGPGKVTETGWNVGSNGDASVCEVGHTNATCLSSCHRLAEVRKSKACGPCDWSTCYDDVAYVQQVLQKLQSVACVDPSRLYLYGESNGGMLVHYLLQRMPGTFAAAVSSQGLPLVGHAAPAGDDFAAVLHLQGRQDRTIPRSGRLALSSPGCGDGHCTGGWHYEPMEETYGAYARVRGCGDPTPFDALAEWEGGKRNVKCEARLCTREGRYTASPRVAVCEYDGEHGDYPNDKDHGDAMVWSYLSQFSLEPRVAREEPEPVRRAEIRRA